MVGGIPTPLKNDGLRQLGWWHSEYMEKQQECSKPPTRWITITQNTSDDDLIF